MKACRKCGETKPLDGFYASVGMRDGHMNTCKDCAASYRKAWRAQNVARTRQLGRDAYRRTRPQLKRDCVRCGTTIPPEAAVNKRYCGKDCVYLAALERSRQATLGGRAGRMCARCGDEIPVTRNLKATTCSAKCRDALNERRQMHTKSRALSNYAVRVGRLVKQPCEVCGNEDVEIHHVDYFEPLNVRWLCFVHHRNLMHGTSIKEEGAHHG